MKTLILPLCSQQWAVAVNGLRLLSDEQKDLLLGQMDDSIVADFDQCFGDT